MTFTSIHDQLTPYFRDVFSNRPLGVMIAFWFVNAAVIGINQVHPLAFKVLMFFVRKILFPVFRLLGRMTPNETIDPVFFCVPIHWQYLENDGFTEAVKRAVKNVVGEAYTIEGDVWARGNMTAYAFVKTNGGSRKPSDIQTGKNLFPKFG